MVCTADQNPQYTTDPRQQHPAHNKGKSRVDPPTNNKAKSSKDKGRDRDKDPGKGKSSASKSSRSKSGKNQWEEEELVQEDATPFYGKPYARSEQKKASLDHSRQDEITTVDPTAYDNTYSAASQPSGEPTADYDSMLSSPSSSIDRC